MAIALTCLGVIATIAWPSTATASPLRTAVVSDARTANADAWSSKCPSQSRGNPSVSQCPSTSPTSSRRQYSRARSPRRVSRTFLESALVRGALAAASDNTDMRETIVLTAVGAGEILKVHSAYNMAKGIEATTTTVDVGLLRFDTPAVRSIDSSSIVVAPYLYFRPASSTGKWSGVRLAPNTVPVIPPGQQLLHLIGSAPIVVSGSSRADTIYSVTFTANDLGLLTSLGAAGTKAATRLTANQKSLLSGVHVVVPKMLVTLDHSDRIVSIQVAARLVESAAAAAAQHLPPAAHGAAGILLITMSYVYGGTLQISAPAASQVKFITKKKVGASK